MCNTESRLDGKTIIVTGGSAGIGYEAAKNLAYKGARVIIASRNKTKLIKARDRLQKLTGNPLITYRQIDLASLKSVRNFASETIKAEERLDDLLLPLLKSSSPSRIINSSASSMYIGHLEFDHWNDIGRYNSIESLANSKLAIALFTAELGNKLKDTGVTANTFDPFIVRETDILNNIPGLIRNASQLFVDVIGQPKEDVGREITFLAADPNMENITGEHYKFCKKWINHWLVNEELLTKQLWDESKKVVNITLEEDWERVT